ncbi:MAG: pantoate--beta-alanine ligase [Phycisphaerae bacterium]|nr:pantoate--beta-alanine ligase [Phycisphaerae bacterium]
MRIVHTINEIRQSVLGKKQQNARVGLVPTMGALHAGHGSLVEAAVEECDFVVVSIFVNPTQFGPSEDFEKYPRTLDTDAAYCEQLGADIIFAPSADQMYPAEQLTWVDTEKLTEVLCGQSRPGHFRGVTTVCAKLFNIVQPDLAYFGQKDAQQAIVIQRMVKDLNMPLEIHICPIVREDDGLAMSSRNKYLSADQRKQALCLYKALTECQSQVAAGQRQVALLIDAMKQVIQQHQGQIDYISIVDPQTLDSLEQIKQKALVLVAVNIGKTRLIDNLSIDLNTPANPI